MVERSLHACLAARQFGQQEKAQVLDFFGATPPECVYCGSTEIRRWDHLVPVKRGGETVVGNMVPACSRCDDSKRDEPFEGWMTSDTQYSPKSRGIDDVDERIHRIRAYARHFGYTPVVLGERLNDEEQSRLARIRSSLQELREEVDLLIEDYRARTGYR